MVQRRPAVALVTRFNADNIARVTLFSISIMDVCRLFGMFPPLRVTIVHIHQFREDHSDIDTKRRLLF